MFKSDGDEHAGRAGRLAFVLLPTAEGAEADAKRIGEGFLGEVKGLPDFGNLALGFPALAMDGLAYLVNPRSAGTVPSREPRPFS